ncbi:monovalent cation:proton antiporter-2 (CPA2) family protein [Kordiimonas lacus]|uniref:Glutathione-regulated potassium-efflux system protein KefB n=2 Tax=Kordiimonas lacus TaxID=637679 RepID=A0A1G6UHC0_9PROT|nr:monovalent cation:proton antiporter-2 (CPA2) family protein [Kordiimonas lacus]SDD39935.1 glutathione-regulated potassium-efflux system protein KefB [Kordiimonas lacus]
MHQDAMLLEILSLMAVAVIAATVFSRLGLSAILGYLVGGMLIGPWGLGLITNPAQIAHLGEFGVVFLLFLIGIELKPARLWVMRRQVFGLGSAQLLVTGVVLWMVAQYGFGFDAAPSALIGFGLALSSTAFGIQLLASKNQLSSQWGRSGFSILLLQDLAVVPLLALVPILVKGEATIGASFGIALLETMAILAGVIMAGRLAINPLFRLVAAGRTPEVFTGFALLLVLGFGWLMESIGLSMAMGAFIAGLLLAESEFRHQVEVDVQPFRGLLLGLFFMSVGMGINIGTLLGHTGLLVSGLLGLLAIKATIIVLLVRAMKQPLSEAIKVGALLAQSGEFGFVLFTYAQIEGLLDGPLVEMLSAVIALSMAVTPLLFLLGERLARQVARDTGVPAPIKKAETEGRKHIVIAGFGRVGDTIARILTDLELPFTAVDLNPEHVKRAREAGHTAIYGDAARPEILRAVGANTAALLVITVDDPKAAERMIICAKRECPNLPIFVRTHNATAAKAMRKLGAVHAVPETLEASLSLGAEVARSLNADEADIQTVVTALRSDDYRAIAPKEGPEGKA